MPHRGRRQSTRDRPQAARTPQMVSNDLETGLAILLDRRMVAFAQSQPFEDIDTLYYRQPLDGTQPRVSNGIETLLPRLTLSYSPPPYSSLPFFMRLPTELILQIGRELDVHDLSRLTRTNWRLYNDLSMLLLKKDARENDSKALSFACAKIHDKDSLLRAATTALSGPLRSYYFSEPHPCSELDQEDCDFPKGQTPLSVAVCAGNLKAVKYLLKQGANVNACELEASVLRPGWHLYPIHLCHQILSPTVSMLLKCDKKELVRIRERMLYALLRAGADVNQQPVWRDAAFTPIWSRNGPTPSAPIFQALDFDKPARAKGRRRNYPTAAIHYNKDMIDWIRAQRDWLVSLLKKGANVNIKSAEGWSPLSWLLNGLYLYTPTFYFPQYCVTKGEYEEQIQLLNKEAMPIIRLLVDNGHRLDDLEPSLGQRLVPLTDQDTLLHKALCLTPMHNQPGQDGLVQFLVESGADINKPSWHGRTPVFEFCDYRPRSWKLGSLDSDRVKLMKWFIDRGADIHHRDTEGNQPLHLACASWEHSDYTRKIIKLLLDHGADPTVKNHAGVKAEDYLPSAGSLDCRWGDDNIFEALRKAVRKFKMVSK